MVLKSEKGKRCFYYRKVYLGIEVRVISFIGGQAKGEGEADEGQRR